MFALVPAPADFEEMLATISIYFTDSGLTLLIAFARGTVACPPQVIMLTLSTLKHSSKFKTGTHIFPTSAGVRSTANFFSLCRIGA